MPLKQSKRFNLLLLGFICSWLAVFGVFIIFRSHATAPVQYFAAPTGKSTGDGSINNPWDLATALKSTKVQPGDTIWLRGGTYGTGGGTVFSCTLKGSQASYITVRGYQEEHAIVDGGIQVELTSQYTQFWGFEVTNSQAQRLINGNQRVWGFNLYGKGTKIINMVVDNTGHPGIGFWDQVGDGGEVYGTLFWGIGLYDTSDPRFPASSGGWTRGSPIYAQNSVGSRYIGDNISFRNFTTGMKAYTENGYANGFNFDGNTVFDAYECSICASAGLHPIDSVSMTNNYIYNRPGSATGSIGFGWNGFSSVQGSATAKNNYVVTHNSSSSWATSLGSTNFQTLNITGNTLISDYQDIDIRSAGITPSYNFGQNKYYTNLVSRSLLLREDGIATGTYVTQAQWLAKIPSDGSSQFLTGTPTQNVVFTRPNKYEKGRGNITIYNWENRSSVAVDISGIVAKGASYKIVDAQNYYGPAVASGTYNGGTVSLPMNLSAVAPIIGNVTHITNTHTPPQFNVFVVIPVSAPVAATSPAPASVASPPAKPSAGSSGVTTVPGSSSAAVTPDDGAPNAAPADTTPQTEAQKLVAATLKVPAAGWVAAGASLLLLTGLGIWQGRRLWPKHLVHQVANQAPPPAPSAPTTLNHSPSQTFYPENWSSASRTEIQDTNK